MEYSTCERGECELIRRAYYYTGSLVCYAQQGRTRCVEYLLAHAKGVIVDKFSALFQAVEFGHINVVRALAPYVDVYCGKESWFCRAARMGYLDLVRYFALEIGVDIHVRDLAFRNAARKGHYDVVQFLDSMGANIHAENDYALSWAAYNGHLPVVQYLINRGVNKRAEEDALRLAACKGHLSVVKFLVNWGVNIHAGDNEALYYAAREGRLSVVQYLLSKGAITSHIEQVPLYPGIA